MKNKTSILVGTRHFFYALLVAVVFCGCAEQNKEKAIIVEYQMMKVSRQMGINDVYDTTRTYKAMFIKDSVCFAYSTSGKFNSGDIIQSIR
jgi:hypothetical protein